MEENKNVVAIQEMQEESYKNGSVRYIDSREVAEMVGKEHRKLLRDIRIYINQIKEISEGQNPKSKIGLSDSEPKRKIAFSDFFIESSYCVDGQSRSYPCYKVTLKGCEFIAHKLTGKKGTEFTARYINRFHEMQDELEGDTSSVDSLADTVKEYMLYQEKRNTEQFAFMQQQVDTNRLQAEFNKVVMEFMRESTQGQIPASNPVNPFGSNESVIKNRMETLNDLVDEVAELCNLDRNKVLHYMYQVIQESEKINLKSYRNVFRAEMKDDGFCTFQVVCSVDRLFEKAMEMNKDVIERKRIYG